MNSNSKIVQEYLESLKEDKELDKLFPVLLNIMKFRIIQTPIESKGQNQYGKDIIAIGKANDGITYKWYFELKGYDSKDITDKNFSSTDGIRESIIEAKDTIFKDSSIKGFNNLPIKIVLVHNGIMKTNVRPTFEGFISKLFKDCEEQFERWDIYYLTELFSKYLFSEYLLHDSESIRLFKKTLVFLDTPDYNYSDFKNLISLQFKKSDSIKGRSLNKLFATLGLISNIIFHYSKENKNITPAKECSKFLILKTWEWILMKNFETKKAITNKFENLLKIQLEIFNSYFKVTFKIAKIENGLFYENGGLYETFGYPFRSFKYIDDMIYFSNLRNHFYYQKNEKLINKQKDLIIEVIKNNSSLERPVLDNHSIVIVQLVLFFLNNNYRRQKDVNFITHYLFNLINNIILTKIKFNRLPDVYNNVDLTIEYMATEKKPRDYTQSTSILLATLLELMAVFNSKEMFEEILKHSDKELSLQIPFIKMNENIELLMFSQNLYTEFSIETINNLPNSIDTWKNNMDFNLFKKTTYDKKDNIKYKYRTDSAGYKFLRYLSHSYYKNEIFADEWRSLIDLKEG